MEYHSIPIEEEHDQLLQKHSELICKTYKIDNNDLKILEVEAKLGEHQGVYYRMTIRDSNRKTYKVKLEKPKIERA
jgi:ribulose bisphosphate carboxylase small subunit